MSLRAELLRLGLRLAVKRRTRLENGVQGWRRSTELAARFVPMPPKAFAVTSVDTGGVKAEVVSWEGSERDILYLHGGGYVLGSPLLFRDLTWRLAKSARARVWCIDYRLAPEHPYPAALEDAVTAYRWLLAGGAAARRIVIMGDSAGGGLALATLLKLRDEGIALPAAAAALSPWTDLALTGASQRKNLDGDPIFQSEEFAIFAGCYLAHCARGGVRGPVGIPVPHEPEQDEQQVPAHRRELTFERAAQPYCPVLLRRDLEHGVDLLQLREQPSGKLDVSA
jgi:epsilon-lactone hydrolase